MKQKEVKRVLAKKEMQYRAEDLKTLTEQRATLIEEMKQLTGEVETEQRAMTEEEDNKFNDLEKQIQSIDQTVEKMERARSMKLNVTSESKHEELKEEELEERAFEAFIRDTVLEERAGELTKTDNGSVIPKSIANKIIKKVEDICPIYKMATKYNVKGTLSIPYYAEDGNDIQMAYATEFKELESTSGKFTNIELTGFLAGALTKVSRSLINNSQFAIVPFVIDAMAQAIARFVERELLHGTDSKVEGLKGIKLTKTAASSITVTMDELIQLKDMIKDTFQQNACFIMNSTTRTALRLLKDANGRYLLQDDPTSPFGTVLLGKPVHVSDQMEGMEAGKKAIFYGDFSGLAVKLSEDAAIQVLREKFATEHAEGVVAWMEFDSKVENAQKMACLQMKNAA